MIARRTAVLAATAFGLFGLAGCATAGKPSDLYLRDFAAAEKQGRTFAPITEVDRGATMDRAYGLQKRIVAARLAGGDRVAGFKGGLMSAKSLADRHVTEPLTAVLFASGAVADGGVVDLCGYRRAAFELKIGYRFKAPVTAPVASVAALKALVAQVQPVVDLPDIAYRDDKTYGAIDMAAANVSAADFVTGAASTDFDGLDDLAVSMRRGSTVLAKGTGRESLGDQWESLRTMVGLVLAHGGRIEAGSLLITGKIGDKGDITPGDYAADYGRLGVVRFTARACAAR